MCTDFDIFARASTVICSFPVFFSYFSGDYYIGPRRSNRPIPLVGPLFVRLLLIFHLFSVSGVSVCVFYNQSEWFILHFTKNRKRKKTFLSPIWVCFVTFQFCLRVSQWLSFIITCMGHVMTIYIFEYIITTHLQRVHMIVFGFSWFIRVCFHVHSFRAFKCFEFQICEYFSLLSWW